MDAAPQWTRRCDGRDTALLSGTPQRRVSRRSITLAETLAVVLDMFLACQPFDVRGEFGIFAA
jgi:hypothetical protein